MQAMKVPTETTNETKISPFVIYVLSKMIRSTNLLEISGCPSTSESCSHLVTKRCGRLTGTCSNAIQARWKQCRVSRGLPAGHLKVEGVPESVQLEDATMITTVGTV